MLGLCQLLSVQYFKGHNCSDAQQHFIVTLLSQHTLLTGR
jgi:hypothetical protein